MTYILLLRRLSIGLDEESLANSLWSYCLRPTFFLLLLPAPLPSSSSALSLRIPVQSLSLYRRLSLALFCLYGQTSPIHLYYFVFMGKSTRFSLGQFYCYSSEITLCQNTFRILLKYWQWYEFLWCMICHHPGFASITTALLLLLNFLTFVVGKSHFFSK